MMVKLLTLIFVFFTVGLVAQPKPLDLKKSAICASKSWIDVDYVGDANVAHRMDIFLPDNYKAPYPIVISIYGSAWLANSWKGSTFYDGLGQRLLKEGYAVASVNYRSSNDSQFPAQIQDIKAAIRFLKANCEIFSIDSSFVGITGWSSGGHLSAMSGTTNDIKKYKINDIEFDIEGSLGQFKNISSKVNAVVDWYGPTNFLSMDSCDKRMNHNDVKSPESKLVGGSIQLNKSKVELSNPITYVKRITPHF